MIWPYKRTFSKRRPQSPHAHHALTSLSMFTMSVLGPGCEDGYKYLDISLRPLNFCDRHCSECRLASVICLGVIRCVTSSQFFSACFFFSRCMCAAGFLSHARAYSAGRNIGNTWPESHHRAAVPTLPPGCRLRYPSRPSRCWQEDPFAARAPE